MSQSAQAVRTASVADAPILPESLRAEMESRRAVKRKFDPREAVGLVVPLCTHLAEIHASGKLLFVHPSSLRFVQNALLQPDLEWMVTPPLLSRDRACLAPEQRKGAPGDARASVFAIGALLYELLTGASVGPGMRRPSECVPGLSANLEAILGKALVADPKHRPADLGALAQALYQSAPGSSMAPPPADASHLDQDGEFEVDVRLSMIPPNEDPRIPRAPNMPRISGDGPYAVMQNDEPPPSVSADPTRRLADMKSRLESDPRPRYVVIKDGMDHGPFSAVELLQQIATGSFTNDHVLRDAISSDERFIKDWEEFSPFAEHAKLNRDIKQEKQAFEATVVKEKQGTQYKALIGGFAMLLVAAVVAGLILRERHRREEAERGVQNDQAVAIDVDGGLAGPKGATAPGAGGPRPAGGGNYPTLGGGMSCEGAQARYVEEYKIGNNGTPADLTAGAYGAVLNRGSYLSSCGVPSNMTVSVCAAVQNGRAVGVTVSTNPPNGGISSCISGRVRGLSFPSHPRLDVARTTFAAN